VRAALTVALGGRRGRCIQRGRRVSGEGAPACSSARALLATVLLASAGAGTYYWASASHGSGDRGPGCEHWRRRPRSEPLPPAAAPAPAAAIRPLAELTLRQAQRALRDGDARRALDLAARHAALYPRSQMAVERGALRVFAFCTLGRKAEARALARELLAEAPNSPLRKSLEESCGVR
jgi:hypothetical protein